MKDLRGSLEWHEVSSKTAGDFRIFKVRESVCRSPEGAERAFSVIDTHDWAMVLPLTDDGNFIMVRQWRHGSKELSVEFPGGVFEAGESPAECAARELREETGLISARLSPLAVMSPNPAIMSNRVHFFLAQNLTETGKTDLDEDEFLDVITVKIDDVASKLGSAPFAHALTASAMFFFERHRSNGG